MQSNISNWDAIDLPCLAKLNSGMGTDTAGNLLTTGSHIQ